MRVRSVTRYLQKSGRLIHARLVEDVDGIYSLGLRLGDRPGEFRLNHFHADAPKTFKDVALAVASLRSDFGCYTEMAMTTGRQPPPK